jgi:hypothetical protein
MMPATQLLDPLSHTRWLGNTTYALLRTTRSVWAIRRPGWPLADRCTPALRRRSFYQC